MGSRSEVLSTHFDGAVRFTAAVSALKWAYQPMVVTAAPVTAAPDVVRLQCTRPKALVFRVLAEPYAGDVRG